MTATVSPYDNNNRFYTDLFNPTVKEDVNFVDVLGYFPVTGQIVAILRANYALGEFIWGVVACIFATTDEEAEYGLHCMAEAGMHFVRACFEEALPLSTLIYDLFCERFDCQKVASKGYQSI